MFRGPVYLTSDVHLGAIPEERARAFREWLRHAGERAGAVVINGDLFDFWFEYGSVVPRGHTRTLGLLAEIVDGGTPVVLFGGNHDWWGGSYLRDEIGVDFRREPAVLELAGWRTLLAHGDGVGEGDLGYRAMSRVIRSRPAQWAFRWLHPDLGARIARAASVTEKRPSHPTAAESQRAETLSAWARERLRAEPDLDVVTMGHVHVPELHAVEAEDRPGPGRPNPRPRYYLNTGDWVHHATYVVLSENARAPRMEEWPVEAPDGRGRDPTREPTPEPGEGGTEGRA